MTSEILELTLSEEPMFVKSDLKAPCASKATPCYTGGQPAYTSVANWMGWPLPKLEEAGAYHEEGSDASTTDTTPYPLDIHDMAWLSACPPIAHDMPLPSFGYAEALVQPSWDHQYLSEMAQQPIDMLSEGSSKHQLGHCKPCAFAWRPEGCASGPHCKFCHLCPPGEKQRRKRGLRQIQRSCAINGRSFTTEGHGNSE